MLTLVLSGHFSISFPSDSTIQALEDLALVLGESRVRSLIDKGAYFVMTPYDYIEYEKEYNYEFLNS